MHHLLAKMPIRLIAFIASVVMLISPMSQPSVAMASASEPAQASAVSNGPRVPCCGGGGTYTYSIVHLPGTTSYPNGIQGFDLCSPPTTTAMQNWWTGTPFWWANFYFGGLNWGCTTPGYVNTSWVSAIHDQGWNLLPTWVSYTAPCADAMYGTHMSSDPTTAYNQGHSEALSAVGVAENLGIGPGAVIADDMEYFSGTSSCYTAVASFINGWSSELHNLGFESVIYISSGSGDAQDLCNRAASITEPDATWITAWNGSLSNFGIAGLSDGCWSGQQRLHQYQGPHYETWNGTTLQVDSDTAYGPTSR